MVIWWLIGSASVSSTADTEVMLAGFIAGMRIGKALMRNLYKEVKVPVR